MSVEWQCPRCRRDNPADMRFCPNCGAAQPAAASQPRWLWPVAIGLWILGCLVIAGGVGFWWLRQGSSPVVVVPSPVGVTEAAPAAPPDTPALATPTTPPTQPPVVTEDAETPTEAEPEATTTPTPAGSDQAGDVLALPTATAEDVIVFLSSRDHEPQSEEQRRQWSQHRNLELYVMRPDGNGQTRLSDGQREWAIETASLTRYLTPNQVVISSQEVFDLLTGQVVEQLDLEFSDPKTKQPVQAYFPDWSVEGAITFFGAGAGSSIYYMENGQTQPQKLTTSPADVWGDGWPVWSPDGQWIAFFRRWHDPAEDGIWLIRPNPRDVRRIIGSSDVRRVFWSPDGSRIAYEGPKANASTFSFELWTAQADGSNPRQLTELPDGRSVWAPHWSPDGRQLVFQVQEGANGPTNIFVIDAEGGEPRQLTTEGYYNTDSLWLALPSTEELFTSTATGDQIALATSIPLSPSPTPPPAAPRPTRPPAAPSNCPNPGVQITAPVEGSTFTQRQVFVIGNANIPRFHHWRLEYSTVKDGHTWNYLFERDYPAENDKLAMIDTSTVPNGPYGLRLTVVDETGNYPEPCEVWYTNGY